MHKDIKYKGWDNNQLANEIHDTKIVIQTLKEQKLEIENQIDIYETALNRMYADLQIRLIIFNDVLHNGLSSEIKIKHMKDLLPKNKGD